ncbi:hypothetical protein MBLNU230_g3424t1 [Neophaeotheca triangularis]
MFECRACLLRSIRAIAAESLPRQSRSLALFTPTLTSLPRRRHATTVHPSPSADLAAYRRSAKKDDGDDDQPPTEKESVGGQREKGIAIQNEKDLKLELRYLKDPMKLADHVHYTLRCEKPDKAVDLCRVASRSMECIVSWNHVIDWNMKRNRIPEALKIYNEMKKRAQFPDSYTYMLLLRGLSTRHHHGQRVKEENVNRAMSVYRSMSSPTSRVKPSILHTNAVLNVCAMALDLDSLWSVAGDIPASGPRAADHRTYTIILNAILEDAKNFVQDRTPDQVVQMRQKSVNQGRRVWQDIIQKWRGGEVAIDTELVSAMGRLLLLSKRLQDWDDVLSLVQQTMNIERLVPPIGSEGRNVGHVPQEEFEVIEDEDSEGFVDTPAAKAFKPATPLPPSPERPGQPKTLAYVQPDNAILSVLIDAGAHMRSTKTCNLYWDKLVTEYGVKPDLANFHAQLRALRYNRASGKAAALLQSHLPAAGIVPKNTTFRIALSVCSRDHKNPHVLDHANTIVNVMETHSEELDIHTLVLYLSLALTTDDGGKITATLNRLDPIVHNLRSQASYGSTVRSQSPETARQEKKDIVTLLQSMIGAIDVLIRRGLVPIESHKHWKARRSQLDAFVGTSRKRIERMEDGKAMQVEGEKAKADVRKARKELGMQTEKRLVMSKANWELRRFRYRKKAEERREAPRTQKRMRTGAGMVDSPGEFGM